VEISPASSGPGLPLGETSAYPLAGFLRFIPVAMVLTSSSLAY
jgi:hypothetical protein